MDEKRRILGRTRKLVLIDYHIITGACQFLKRSVLDQDKGNSKHLSGKGGSWSGSLQWCWSGLLHVVRREDFESHKVCASMGPFVATSSILSILNWCANVGATAL